MSMTIVVTRNVSHRIRGFLASTMIELAPGTYTAPKMSPTVRERVWTVINEWAILDAESSIVMVWKDPTMPGGQNVRIFGTPPLELVEIDGLLVSRKTD